MNKGIYGLSKFSIRLPIFYLKISLFTTHKTLQEKLDLFSSLLKISLKLIPFELQFVFRQCP